MKMAVPDLVSNSYFPALAAVELGCFRDQGLDVEIELIFPPDRAYAAMRDGAVDLVAASAHSAVSAFPDWRGVRLLCAQSRGMYWLLVMHRDFAAARGDLSVLRGRRIGAAPWVELGLRGVLASSGLDPERDRIAIGPIPKSVQAGANFGLSAFQALEARAIDGFWANGMAAELAVTQGVGTIVLDARRDGGPGEELACTFPSIAASERALAADPGLGAATKRAIDRAHALLREDVTRATEVGRRLFPPAEAALIATLIERDLPYYNSDISEGDVIRMNALLRRFGLLGAEPAFSEVVLREPSDRAQQRGF